MTNEEIKTKFEKIWKVFQTSKADIRDDSSFGIIDRFQYNKLTEKINHQYCGNIFELFTKSSWEDQITLTLLAPEPFLIALLDSEQLTARKLML